MSGCKKTCASEELDCYILDNNGFIIISEKHEHTGKFFGEIDGTIMDSLVQDKIFRYKIFSAIKKMHNSSQNRQFNSKCAIIQVKIYNSIQLSLKVIIIFEFQEINDSGLPRSLFTANISGICSAQRNFPIHFQNASFLGQCTLDSDLEPKSTGPMATSFGIR